MHFDVIADMARSHGIAPHIALFRFLAFDLYGQVFPLLCLAGKCIESSSNSACLSAICGCRYPG